ncbi:MAG: UDP-2,3-diacylglucosamine diphosphatase LpxI [Kiritimatiellae bacterium]|nr:UDP-2,3-diacylglucosamine diphosphatase LpxI [Kiritimatiellia bacterium]
MRAPSDVLVIAGAGVLPRLAVQGARRAGVSRIGVLGFKGATPRATLALGDWSRRIPLKSLAVFRDAIREAGFGHAILLGQIGPLAYFRAAFDPEVRAALAEMPAHNAHTIFTRLIEEIEKVGPKVLPSSLFLGGEIPAAPGPLTRRAFSPEEAAAAKFGRTIAEAVCDLDIGQTVVVKDGVALAVEGFDGTNATILRGGRIARRGAVVVKVAKRGHDMRFDIPVVGAKTLAVMRKAHCTALFVQAGRTLFAGFEAVVREADRRGIAIEAFDSGLPPAPVAQGGAGAAAEGAKP